MSVKNENQETEQTKIIDDVFDTKSEEVDPNLEVLKAKLAQKKKESAMPINIVQKKKRSIRLGFVGSGQGGSNLASTAFLAGYDAIVFNTAPQDLEHVPMPESNKYLLEYGLGGAARDLELGRAAAETHRDAIAEMVADKLEDAQVLIFCLSLGGGSGAGSCETMIDVLSATGKPVVVMTVLPMSAEDSQIKRNALETLSKLAKEAQNKRIHNLIVVDNAKIETIFSDVSPMAFYGVSNKAIVEPLDAFNTLSSASSSVKPLDPMEWAKILTDGGGLSVYGEMNITNFEDDTSSIAEAVIENLNTGLLASGFDLKQSRYVGVIIAGNAASMDKITNQHITYAMAMLGEICGVPNGIFKGIYVNDEINDGVLKVYSIFSGLGLPDSRVQQLKKEAAEFAEKAKNKDNERNLNLKLETGKDETVSAAEKVRAQIAAKKSAFGGLVNSSVQDRRKK